MLVTLHILKQCLYQNTEYGSSVFVFDVSSGTRSYAYSPVPSDLEFCQQILPGFIIDPAQNHDAKKWPNKTTLSYIMNRKLNMNGMKIYHHNLSYRLLNADHVEDLIVHCDQYLNSFRGYSAERFQNVVYHLSSVMESELNQELLVLMLRQLSRIHAGAALAFLIIHSVLHLKEAADSITNYLQTPSGSELLVTCEINFSHMFQNKAENDPYRSSLSDNSRKPSDKRLSASESISSAESSSGNRYAFTGKYHYTDPIVTFVGRKTYLSHMMKMMHDQSDYHHLFLFGISGIGKTELVRKYAATYRNYYRFIWMLHYRNSIRETICFELPIAGFDDSNARVNPMELNRVFAEKLVVLKSLMDDHCLLILDNMNTSEDPDLDLLIGQNFPVLITTQIDFSDRGYQTLAVHALESGYEDTSGNFFSLSRNVIDHGKSSPNLSDFEERGVTLEFFQKIYGRKLSDRDLLIIHNLLLRFSGHTFITELLARQMKISFLNADALAKLLDEHGIFATKSIEQVSHQSSHTPKAVYDYLSTIIQPEKLSIDEQYILKNLSIMPQDGISVFIFHDLCRLTSYESIWKLTNRSLMLLKGEKGEETISLHPLIRELVLHNLEFSPDDFSNLFRELAALSKESWSKPKKDLDIYHDLVKTVLSNVNQYSEETLLYASALLEFTWQYGHFEFVIRKCEEGLDYAKTKNYGHEVRGSLCRVAGNCLYSAGLVYRNESTHWFQLMLKEYRQVSQGRNCEIAYALKNIARAKLNQAVVDFGLKITPDRQDSYGYMVSQRFSYPEIQAESRRMLEKALLLTNEADELLKLLISGTEDESLLDTCLSYLGDIHFIHTCILLYLHTDPAEMIRELDDAIHRYYHNEIGTLRSLSVTAAMTLKAKIYMLNGQFKLCDQLLHQAAASEELYRGTSKNTHLLRILIAEGDSAYLQNHTGNAHKFYGMARDTINRYDYLDKGRFYEEVSEKYAATSPGYENAEYQFTLTPGL